jgi:hypothetical protein
MILVFSVSHATCNTARNALVSSPLQVTIASSVFLRATETLTNSSWSAATQALSQLALAVSMSLLHVASAAAISAAMSAALYADLAATSITSEEAFISTNVAKYATLATAHFFEIAGTESITDESSKKYINCTPIQKSIIFLYQINNIKNKKMIFFYFLFLYSLLQIFIIMNIMNKPIRFLLDNIKVYEAINVYNYDPSFFFGCSRIRLIINKKKLNDDDYIFGYIKNGNWIKSKKTYSKAKLLLNASWVETNVPKFKITSSTNETIKENTIKIKIKKDNTTIDNNEEDVKNDNDNEVYNNLYDISPAPDILELDDHEQFKDNKDNIMNIEVRGERNRKGCYFNVKDVSDSFKIKNLNTTIIHKYDKNIHYKYFTLKRLYNVQSPQSKNVYIKKMFLTYRGLLKVLFCSRSGNAEHFQNWAEDILFTVQMGTTFQKNELVSKVLGVTALAVKEVFKTSVTTTPCVYLFTLNTVKELRDSMDIDESIPDNFIVAKYGMTKNLEQRTTQHLSDYGKMVNVDLKLKCYTYVDPQYITDAETDISDFFKNGNMMFKYQNRSELVLIDPSKIKKIEKQYNIIFKLYAGHIKDLMIRIKELENELLLIKVTHMHELQEEKHKNELLQRDLETTCQDFKIKELTFLLNKK